MKLMREFCEDSMVEYEQYGHSEQHKSAMERYTSSQGARCLKRKVLLLSSLNTPDDNIVNSTLIDPFHLKKLQSKKKTHFT